MSTAVLPPFTDRTQVAIAIARGIAASRGAPDLNPTHLALGLLREGENAAVAVLQHAGIELGRLRSALEADLDTEGRLPLQDPAIPLTPGEQRLVDLGREESRLKGTEYLGTEHLLLAILRDQQSPTARLFAHHGLRHSDAQALVDQLLQRSPQSQDPNPPAPPSN